jgi:hypothetical protein
MLFELIYSTVGSFSIISGLSPGCCGYMFKFVLPSLFYLYDMQIVIAKRVNFTFMQFTLFYVRPFSVQFQNFFVEQIKVGQIGLSDYGV